MYDREPLINRQIVRGQLPGDFDYTNPFSLHAHLKEVAITGGYDVSSSFFSAFPSYLNVRSYVFMTLSAPPQIILRLYPESNFLEAETIQEGNISKVNLPFLLYNFLGATGINTPLPRV